MCFVYPSWYTCFFYLIFFFFFKICHCRFRINKEIWESEHHKNSCYLYRWDEDTDLDLYPYERIRNTAQKSQHGEWRRIYNKKIREKAQHCERERSEGCERNWRKKNRSLPLPEQIWFVFFFYWKNCENLIVIDESQYSFFLMEFKSIMKRAIVLLSG